MRLNGGKAPFPCPSAEHLCTAFGKVLEAEMAEAEHSHLNALKQMTLPLAPAPPRHAAALASIEFI